MRKRKNRNWARRSISKKPRTWCIYIEVKKGRNNGEFSGRIYFQARGGGGAKVKATPKLQGFLMGVLGDCDGSPSIDVILKCVSRNGDGKAPSYILRAGRSYFRGIISARRPSQLFIPV